MSTEPRNTLQWLAANAVVLAEERLLEYNPGRTVWCLPDHLHEKLIYQLTEYDDHFNQGSTKDYMFLTTDRGFIIIHPTSIQQKDLVKYNGRRYLRTEVNRDHWYSPVSMYAKWMEGVTTNDIVTKELDRVQVVLQKEAEAAAYKAKIARVEKEVRDQQPSNEAFQALIDKAMNFDHTFEYSDDHRYCIRTRAQLRELEAAITAEGADGWGIMAKIMGAHGGQ